MNTELQNIIRCRAAVGTQIKPSKPWVAGEPVTFIWAPSGLHTITAGFREGEGITISVAVDEDTPQLLQEAFNGMGRGRSQEPFADEDHESRKATLRFPLGKTRFEWGEVNGVEGVVVAGAEPTGYGADLVNGRTYRSWSPEFETDADFSAAVCKNGHWEFPAFVRGSTGNPARITGVGFCVGALTNKPAFRAMPPVKAKQAASPSSGAILQKLARETARRDAARSAVLARLSHA